MLCVCLGSVMEGPEPEELQKQVAQVLILAKCSCCTNVCVVCLAGGSSDRTDER